MNDAFIVKRTIDKLDKLFKEQIAYDLSCKFDKILRLNDVCFQKIISYFHKFNRFNRIRDFQSMTKTEFLIMVFNEEPFIILNEILPYIIEKQIVKDIKNINTNDDYKKYEFSIYDELKITDFSIITHIDEPIVIDESESWVEEVLNYKIKYCDLFDKKVYFDGTFIRENNISAWDVEEAGLKLTCNVKGVIEDESIPAFIEYLLEACINVKYKNHKMALFNLFASFDNFIELLYEITFEFFINQYSRYKDMLKEQIKEELMEKELSNYEIVYNEIFVAIDSYLKKKIRSFANQNRRLIDEKLISVLKEVNIHKNEKYVDFNKIVSELKDIEIKRNSIAHGEKVEIEENIGEIMYKILTIIFSIIYEQDFSKNEWNKILYNDEEY